MAYDFTSIMDRHGMDAMAVDGLGLSPMAPQPPREGFDIIPMWVADMNFPTFPAIAEAMIRRAGHPAFGYFSPRDEYFNSIIQWQENRNQVVGLKKEHIGYENGVLGGVISAMNVLCSKGGSVLVHSPTYIGFTSCLTNNGYDIVSSPLVLDGRGVWRMDFEDMEKKIADKKIHTAIFSSPHNPCGRVWEKWELEKAMELFKKHDVTVISDEIWSDLLLQGYRHIPTQSVSEDAKMRTIALYAPSKTFNLAGLIGSYHIIYNQYLRERIEKEASLSHYNTMNLMSMYALMGAYQPGGQEWVDQLRQVITENVDYAVTYIREHFDGVRVSRPEGTYMLFLDCSDWCGKMGKTIEEVEGMAWEVGVACQDGRMFHGPCHLRLNLALPLSRVKDAFERLDQYVFNRKEELPASVLKEGGTVPDFGFRTPFERDLTLGEAVKAVPGKTALLFLRYYGCTLCQYDIHQYKIHYDAVRAKGGQLLLVLQSDPDKLAAQLKKEDLPFSIICDPDAALYKRFGVAPAASREKMGGPGTMAKIEKARAAGFRHGEYEGNEMQLPAVFLMDRDCRLEYVHYGASVDDVPEPEELAEKM